MVTNYLRARKKNNLHAHKIPTQKLLSFDSSFFFYTMTALSKLLRDEKLAIPIKIMMAYALWKLFYHFADTDGTSLGNAWDQFAIAFGNWYASSVAMMLNFIGIKTVATGIRVHMTDYDKSLTILEHCLAIPACVVFTITIVLFKGSLSDKLWFIPLGLLGITLVNLLRQVFLGWVLVSYPGAMFAFHHSVVTVGVTYGLIFLMIGWWMKRNIV